MKVLLINSVCGIRSTGRICTDIAGVLTQAGDECRIGYGRVEAPEDYRQIAVPIGGKWDIMLHGLGSRLFDNTGVYSGASTCRFLKWVDEYKPDLVHLHNIHGYYLNIELLFNYLKEKSLPVVWTLHDCWAFTGHCSHFASAGCKKWKTQCESCDLCRFVCVTYKERICQIIQQCDELAQYRRYRKFHYGAGYGITFK